MKWRTAVFLSSCVLIAVGVWSMQTLGHARIVAKYSSQTVFIPLLCAYLLWDERKRIFTGAESGTVAKLAPFAIGFAITGLFASFLRTSDNIYLFEVFALLSVILLVIGSFVVCYGSFALRRALFPFTLLLLAIPFPESVVQGIISILQVQSAWLSSMLFSLIGIPVFKQGVLLTIPGVSIEVARECSGINSSIALVLTMLLVARQSLRSNWRRAALVAATVPLSVTKNAIRITTLTVLAVRVDPSFLTGSLHHQGGFVFYLLAMGLLYPVWKLLKAGDKPDNYEADVTTCNTALDHSKLELQTRA